MSIDVKATPKIMMQQGRANSKIILRLDCHS
jgi:hypothetical protein